MLYLRVIYIRGTFAPFLVPVFMLHVRRSLFTYPLMVYLPVGFSGTLHPIPTLRQSPCLSFWFL